MSNELKRGLKNRHIQLIALGGAVGTGLFLGSAGVLKTAGPSMILGYLMGGFITFLIMRQLGEMIVEEPVAGSFSHFANRYWGNAAGFVSGWNYWILYILVGMSELTAVGKYIIYWWPSASPWMTAVVFFVLINLINLANVKLYGESEFWFAIIKVAAIIGMILLGSYLLISGEAGPEAKFSNLWEHGGFFPNGASGLFMMLAIITFSYGGLELIGITAAEADDPHKSIPKAINQVLFRILVFYVGALTVLLALVPWNTLVETISTHGAQGDIYGGSPFVIVFAVLGNDTAAHVLNFVVLTAALSVYNSCVYCTSRMLYGLSEQGNAPKALMNTDKRGVPVLSIGVSALFTVLCVLVNYLLPQEALVLLMSLVVAALVINWAMISLTHIKFRRAKVAEAGANLKLRFPAIFYPYSNILALIFVLFILGSMLMVPSISVSVYAIPVWLVFLGACYWVKEKRKSHPACTS